MIILTNEEFLVNKLESQPDILIIVLLAPGVARRFDEANTLMKFQT